MAQNPLIEGPYNTYPVQFNEASAADVTAWKLARSVIEHENTLVHYRLTWFFSSQGFLVAAFFIILQYSDKPIIKENLVWLILAVGALAIYMCMVTSSGIEGAYRALGHVTEHYEGLKKSLGFKRTPPLHEWSPPSLIDARRVPFVTLIVWVALVALCGVIQIPSINQVVARITPEQKIVAAVVIFVVSGIFAIGFLIGRSKKNAT